MKNFVLIALILISTFSFSQKTDNYVRIGDLDLQKVDQLWGKAMQNKAVNGISFNVLGEKSSHGIGTISNSSITILLHEEGQIFKGKVGVQQKNKKEYPNLKFNALGDGTKMFYDEREIDNQFLGIGQEFQSISEGSVYFIIKADGKELWKSEKLSSNKASVAFEINVEGVNLLELIVEDAGDGVSGDHANWMDPVISYTSKKPQIVTKGFQSQRQASTARFNSYLKEKMEKLPLSTKIYIDGLDADWLVENVELKAGVFRSNNLKEIMLSNGLVSRTFRITPNCATVDFNNLMNDVSLLRGVSPEAEIEIDGKKYMIGGLEGQIEYGYLKKSWLDDMWSHPNAFQLVDFHVNDLKPRINWKNKRWSLQNKNTTGGKHITFDYEHSDLADVKVSIHYEIYDGVPVISKWMTVLNKGANSYKIHSIKTEILATHEPESAVERGENNWLLPNIHVESNYAFHAMSFKGSNKVVHWENDPRYTSQVNYRRIMPCLLVCKLPIGPYVDLEKEKEFESFRIWEMPYDSYDRQRKGLSLNKFYNAIAPWTSENPMFLHLTTTDEAKVKAAIDQCVETGYEMVILSFGSGLNMEDVSESNIAKFKGLADYAHKKGIELGGYSLLSSRWISEEVDVIHPETGKRGGTIHGSAPCLNSQWGIDYFEKLKYFFEQTGFDLLEHDGSYPGQYCASTKHVGHDGLEDSQWKAWKRISDFYIWCNENGISLNIPDWYYLSGSTKNGIGYREVNWSLPRERQLVLGRQNIYDGTWERTPSMSWTFVPLTQYHGGGAAATIEPLNEHLDAYKAHMIQNYGSGVQACYRGPRLYDTEETKETVVQIVEWYKRYRDILNSPLIHLKRADGRSIDGFMHVNPTLKEKGFVLFFNPTGKPLKKTFELPLYYTGLTKTAMIREKEKKSTSIALSREYTVKLKVELDAGGYTWFIIE